MTLLSRVAILSCVFCLCPWGPHPIQAVQLTCEKSIVTFDCQGTGDFRCVCTAAERALGFLASVGLEPTDPIIIRLVDQIPAGTDHTLVGSYNTNTREVLLLTYEKATELAHKNLPDGENRLSEILWCAYAAHELTHIISDPYLLHGKKAHTAAEYISSVTQVMTLSPESREEFLTRYADVSAYESRKEMSELYYLMDPNRFAVKCYLHFISQENPKAFIQQLIKTRDNY